MSPITSTSNVDKVRCTSTLSMTTWKNNGDTSANNCRKKDAISTSPSMRRYLWMAPKNQVISKRRPRSVSPERRVISTSRPSQAASNSARLMMAGRGDNGDCTRTLSSPTFPRIRKRPSVSAAIAGIGVFASRSHRVDTERAFTPNCLAQRSISVTPIVRAPN